MPQYVNFFMYLQACDIARSSKHRSIVKLQQQGILEGGKHYSPGDVFKELASLHIYKRYFHNHHHDSMDADKNDAHMLHYK